MPFFTIHKKKKCQTNLFIFVFNYCRINYCYDFSRPIIFTVIKNINTFGQQCVSYIVTVVLIRGLIFGKQPQDHFSHTYTVVFL